MKVQLSREVKGQPTLVMKLRENIDEYKIDDFELLGYEPAGVIKAPMAV
jgi:thymidylate synthase